MIKIGYQGIQNSNSEAAAIEFVKHAKLKNYIMLPLVSSFNVLDNVDNGNIDYGVIAYRNNTGGTVKESVQALKFLQLQLVEEITMPISHYLFVKCESISIASIEAIASHPQAFVQCQHTLSENYPNTILVHDEDTATAARKLRLELFSEHTAVLCRKNAGEKNNLYLVHSNLEDRNDNSTSFRVYKK